MTSLKESVERADLAAGSERLLATLERKRSCVLLAGAVEWPKRIEPVPKPSVWRSEAHTFFELAYLDAGRCAIVAEGTGYVLEQGDVCIIPPSQVHYEAPIPPSDASYDLYWLSFVPPRVGFQLARYEGATQSIREVDGVAQYLGDTALDLLEKATSELRTGQRHAYAAAHGYLSVLAALVSRQVFEWREQGANRREQWNDQVIREVVHFIGRNFHRPDLSVADMANHVAFSPSYFSVYFKDRTGCSPYRYLLEMRMQRAGPFSPPTPRPSPALQSMWAFRLPITSAPRLSAIMVSRRRSIATRFTTRLILLLERSLVFPMSHRSFVNG